MRTNNDNKLTQWVSRKLSSTHNEMEKSKYRNTDFERAIHDISFSENEVISRTGNAQLSGIQNLIDRIKQIGEEGPLYSGAFNKNKYPKVFEDAVDSLLKELEALED